MATGSNPRPRTRPRSSQREYPRLRAAVWMAALLSGGLVIVLIFFSTIGVVNFVNAPWVGVAAIVMATFFLVTTINYARSERRGNTRWNDRERRGF